VHVHIRYTKIRCALLDASIVSGSKDDTITILRKVVDESALYTDATTTDYEDA
jgi:hypothetical protein